METPQNAVLPTDPNVRSNVRSSVHPPSAVRHPPLFVVLCGNPNSGKTTLFNALTGLRARVGNYAGVTVERKEGRLARRAGRTAGDDARFARHLQPQPAIVG